MLKSRVEIKLSAQSLGERPIDSLGYGVQNKKGPKSQKTKNYQLVDWSVVVRLHAVLLLQLQVLLPEGVDGVNHDLDQLDLGVAETVLVGDIISVA